MRDWLSRIDKDAKEARDKRIFALWLACHTYDEIAETEGVSAHYAKDAVSSQTENLPSGTEIRCWAAEQIIRQHTEPVPLVEFKDPVTKTSVLAPYRATGRCPHCGPDGCDLYAWARTVTGTLTSP